MIASFKNVIAVVFLIIGQTLSKNIVIVGATGQLGRILTKQGVDMGHIVTAIARDEEKFNSLFDQNYRNKLTFIKGDVESLSEENMDRMTSAFRGNDIIIEVLSNTQRPQGIKFLLDAAERAQVGTFIACGGAGTLFESKRPDAKRVYEAHLASMSWLKDVSELHMEVQELAFASRIAIVAQICPPEMVSGEVTGKALPTTDLSLGLWKISYEDVSSIVLDLLPRVDEYNRHMIGFRYQQRVMTVLGHDGKVKDQKELKDHHRQALNKEL